MSDLDREAAEQALGRHENDIARDLILARRDLARARMAIPLATLAGFLLGGGLAVAFLAGR